MQLLLSPEKGRNDALWTHYRRAFRAAKELFIATAFLTEWSGKQPLNSKCSRVLFLVGTDFGLTRKEACQSVLQWLPKRFSPDLLAMPALPNGGFHPKVVVWKEHTGERYAIVGSSNLTRAGLAGNVEANVLLALTGTEYQRLVHWIERLAQDSQVINEQWIEQYRESHIRRRGNGRPDLPQRVIRFRIPAGQRAKGYIEERRAKQRAFAEIAAPLRSAIRACASDKISNSVFWRRFWDMWAHHGSRFQGSGLQIKDKSANWHEACQAMWTILEHSKHESPIGLDRIVREQLDVLTRAKNPARRAWFTEILCHYFPKQYPLVNNPVKRWLRRNKWQPIRATSEGAQYIDLARKLREAVRQTDNGPRNLAELDSLIWWR